MGDAACQIMGDDRARELGYKPKAYLKAWTFVSLDPYNDMLLGPAVATARVLHMAGLTLKDIGVFEIHEAFAGQVRPTLSTSLPLLRCAGVRVFASGGGSCYRAGN